MTPWERLLCESLVDSSAHRGHQDQMTSLVTVADHLSRVMGLVRALARQIGVSRLGLPAHHFENRAPPVN